MNVYQLGPDIQPENIPFLWINTILSTWRMLSWNQSNRRRWMDEKYCWCTTDTGAVLSAKALQVIYDENVLAYCLPAHTSGLTQPLDVGLYGPLKSYIDKEVKRAVQMYHVGTFDLFYLLHIIKRAYEQSFTEHNIRSAFSKSGLWPFNKSILLVSARPRSADDADSMMTPTEL